MLVVSSPRFADHLTPPGHPESPERADVLEAIAARRAGKEADPLALYFPNSWDGLLGVRFVNSVIESSNLNGKWVKC